ncbi:hypothetical protein [Achromobacter xylosoxidans]|uniref:hypothetical protein n=1 Tax=Alcaligenes xylosoxydans xylosoxydans TaxID=85698 RepID=UPI001EED738D|nr:hypothetical protein [Achromobacter xylosoxidans]
MRLDHLYSILSPDERKGLALRAGINPGYLWQIATRWRGRKPSSSCITKLLAADHRLSAADMLQELAEQPPSAQSSSSDDIASAEAGRV